tara:strand:+ start:64 stop:1029 length:966 start_codon:yes stop_codon:yes gene_type:complete
VGHAENFYLENFSLAGVVGESIVFESGNPLNYFEAIEAPHQIERINISGKLFIASSDNLSPAVIVVPGSLGVGENHLQHAETIVSQGIAAFVIDPFANRNVESTVANQTPFSFAASAFDVLMALETIAKHPKIDANRISAQGHSRGGSAVLMASTRQFADPIIGSNLCFEGVYAVYPWCGHQFLKPSVGHTKVRAIVGERDDWLSVQQVQSQIQAVALDGGDASIRIVKGASHSFDWDEEVYEIPEASVAPEAPTVYLDATGAMIDPVTGEANSLSTDRTHFLAAIEGGFGRRGAHVGSSGEQAYIFREDMLQFHKSTLRV